MSPRLKIASPFLLPLLFSLVLHAAATGLVFWMDGSETNSAAPEVWLTEETAPALPTLSPPRKILKRATEPSMAPPETASAVSEPRPAYQATDMVATANEIFDLSSPQTHPYFARLRHVLSDAMRGLMADVGHPEQFSIQIEIKGSGEIVAVRVSGEDSRLKSELKERMARIGFVPELPEEILFGKEKIEIRYRVLFSR